VTGFRELIGNFEFSIIAYFWTRLSCRWQTSATRCVTPIVLYTKVDA